MHMLSIIIITHTGSVISPSKMVMWAQETDPARLLCNAPYNTGLTHSITLFISINRHPWPITTKKLYNDPDSSWYRMSVFLHQNRPPVIFKRGSLYQYTPENGQWVNIPFRGCLPLCCESAGWQAGPSLSELQELCRCLLCSVKPKRRKDGLWQRTAVNQMVCSHLVVQWAVTEVTSVWLISMPWNHMPSQGSHQHVRWQHVRISSARAPMQASSLPSLLAAQSLHGALVLLERPKPMEYC